MTSRRDFLKSGSVLAAGAAVGSAWLSNPLEAHAQNSAITKYELPKLPYAYDALEPFIDARMMELHHTIIFLPRRAMSKAADGLCSIAGARINI